MCFIKLAKSSPWSPYSSVRIAITFRSINFIRIRSFIFSFRTVLSALLLACPFAEQFTPSGTTISYSPGPCFITIEGTDKRFGPTFKEASASAIATVSSWSTNSTLRSNLRGRFFITEANTRDASLVASVILRLAQSQKDQGTNQSVFERTSGQSRTITSKNGFFRPKGY